MRRLLSSIEFYTMVMMVATVSVAYAFGFFGYEMSPLAIGGVAGGVYLILETIAMIRFTRAEKAKEAAEKPKETPPSGFSYKWWMLVLRNGEWQMLTADDLVSRPPDARVSSDPMAPWYESNDHLHITDGEIVGAHVRAVSLEGAITRADQLTSDPHCRANDRKS